MKVKKRNGEIEEVSFDKVIRRIKNLCDENCGNKEKIKTIDASDLAQKVCARIYDNVKTSQLDELAAQICASYVTEHPDYGLLASRIIISNHQKNTSPSFSETINMLYNAKTPLVSKEIMDIVECNKEKINSVMDYDRDYMIDFFGFKTLERSYLLSVNDKVVERPQHMFMRVSLGIHGNDIKEAIETYEMMSLKYFIHATPTLFNSGTPRPQMASCFLQAMKEDSIDGIFDTLKSCAKISKYSGGVGLHIHNVRGRGAYIKGTNGKSNGIIPMLGVYNKTAMYVDQCFRGDTQIYTQNGTTKIENIKEDDYVLTSDGSYKKVLKTIKKQVNKQTLRIRTKNSIDTIYVTPEHQIYAMINPPSIHITDMVKYLDDNLHFEPKYVDASKLTTFDYIGYPIPQKQNDNSYDKDDCVFAGFMFCNGYENKNKSIIYFYKGKNKDFVIDYFNKKSIEYIDNYNKIEWNTTEKTKNVDKYISLNKEDSTNFIIGCLKSNGCEINEKYQCMFFNTNSKQKAYIMKYMFMKIGILVDGFFNKEQNNYILAIPYTKKLFEMLDYSGNASLNKNITFFEYNNILWTGIKSINKMSKYDGLVYDLNIEDNHNYVTEMGIVHNSGKRNGNFAIYLEPSHPDIETFIDLRKNHGNESERCRDLFTAIWMPDLFMKRVENKEMWSLMCPDKCPGLADCYGDEYEELYTKYENNNMYEKQVKAQDLWISICKSQIETGTPYLVFKDSANKKSNQKNIGTVKSSNLCVSGNTDIITTSGVYEIKNMVNQITEIWNGFEFSQVEIKKTGTNVEMMKIEFSNGECLICTPEHIFYIEINDNQDAIKVKASDLKQNMKIINYNLPLINYKESKEVDINTSSKFADKAKWLLHTIKKNGCFKETFIEINDPDSTIEPIIHSMGVDFKTCDGKINCCINDMKGIKTVPINNITIKNIIKEWNTEDSYCFTEPIRNYGVFNGILTGQCAEIIEYSDKDETAVCNLASIALPTHIKNHAFDFDSLAKSASIVCKNLNKVIDRTFYPTKETEYSNKKHRPIGIGVQGLADTYAILNLSFESDEAKELNKKIFETIYYGAMKTSCELSKKYGPYQTFEGSPISKGEFQFDLNGISKSELSGLWNWEELRKNVMKHGVRNSLMIALMPTASTSQILGFNECFEPFTSNIYQRRTLAGEFFVVNKYLLNSLIKNNLWNKDMKNKIMNLNGSIQDIQDIPKELKDIFKTVWEIKPRTIIDQAVDRGPFVCQSQSMNIFIEDAEITKISNMHFYSWKKGLKTGIYYLRTRPKAKTIAFTSEICESCSA